MSINPVTSRDPAKAAAQVSTAQATITQPPAQSTVKEPTESKPKPTTSTVNISSAGKAALQEATETAAQTAGEARSGDHQAQRALAKAAALHVEGK